MPCSPAPEERFGDVRRVDLPRHTILAFAAAFFLCIFCVSALRSWLRDPLAFDAFQLNRLASSLLGTAFFASMIGGLAQRATAPLAAHANLILSRAMLAAVALTVARPAIDLNAHPAPRLSPRPPQPGRRPLACLCSFMCGAA